MHKHLGEETCEEELVQAQGETEAGPVMSVLEDVEAVALEVHGAVEVHFVEGLDGDLVLAIVLGAIGLGVELEVVLDGAAGVLDFLVLARRHRRRSGPVGHQNGNGREDGEEDGGEEATADLASDVPGDEEEEGEEEDIGEGVAAGGVGGERSIFDGGILSIDVSILLLIDLIESTWQLAMLELS